MKLAECLLRRKELQDKLSRMDQIRQRDLYEVRVKRIKVTDAIDEVTANVPKLTYAQFDAEYSHYARQLRLVDAAIQQVNWTAEVPNIDRCFEDYTAPAE